jgi:hypothetical protein
MTTDMWSLVASEKFNDWMVQVDNTFLVIRKRPFVLRGFQENLLIKSSVHWSREGVDTVRLQ